LSLIRRKDDARVTDVKCARTTIKTKERKVT